MWMIHNLFSNDGESEVESIVALSLDTSPRYQKVARDDVCVHFEKEGPDMMFMQCSIGDETLREELRNKLEVVIRRYVVEAVISLKLLIKISLWKGGRMIFACCWMLLRTSSTMQCGFHHLATVG